MSRTSNLSELLDHFSYDVVVDMVSPSGARLFRRSVFFGLLKDIDTHKVKVKTWEMDPSGIIHIETKNEFTKMFTH